MQDRTIAFYPGPAGATESELPLEAWQRIVEANPELAVLRPDVEALLVRRTDGPHGSCYLVPIDTCYELVGRLRQLWRGFDGGQQAHEAMDEFFADGAATAAARRRRSARHERLRVLACSTSSPSPTPSRRS